MPSFWMQMGSVEQGSHAQREPQVLPVFSSLLEITFFIPLTTGSCFSSTREALSEH